MQKQLHRTQFLLEGHFGRGLPEYQVITYMLHNVGSAITFGKTEQTTYKVPFYQT